MQIENDYEKEVYNGDIGTIDDVDSNSGELIASFDGRSITYGFGELDMLVPAYDGRHGQATGSCPGRPVAVQRFAATGPQKRASTRHAHSAGQSRASEPGPGLNR